MTALAIQQACRVCYADSDINTGMGCIRIPAIIAIISAPPTVGVVAV